MELLQSVAALMSRGRLLRPAMEIHITGRKQALTELGPLLRKLFVDLYMKFVLR